MLLIVSNSTDTTADYLQNSLNARNLPFSRIDTDLFPISSPFCVKIEHGNTAGVPCCSIRDFDLSNVSAIWWRRPERYGQNHLDEIRDDRIRAFASDQVKDGFVNLIESVTINRNIIWVNHPEKNRSADIKINQLCVASKIGFKIPNTYYGNDPVLAEDFYSQHCGDIVFKAVKRSAFTYENMTYGHFTTRVDRDAFKDTKSIEMAPIFLQERIRKAYELRATVIGNDVFVARINSQNHTNGQTDWRLIPNRPELWHSYDLDEITKNKCRRLIAELGLKFGAIDMAKDDEGEYVFFEVNPNGQWAWIEMETDLPMTDSFIRLFYSSESAYQIL